MGLLLAAAAGAVLSLLYLWFVRPEVIVKYSQQLLLRLAGLKVRTARARDGRVLAYAERGAPRPGKSSLVFVHGFTDRKDTWLPLVKKLSPDEHVILVDQLGHGDTDLPPAGDDVSYDAFVDCVKELVCAAGLSGRPVHLVGQSMGGLVASLYAARHPRDVARLTLVCPAVVTPEETEFMKEARNGQCRLLPTTTDGVQAMIDVCVHKKLRLPRQVLRGMLVLRQPRTAYYRTVFDFLMGTLNNQAELKELEDERHRITMPTQVIWGEKDEVLHVSGAEALRGQIPGVARVDVVPAAGHLLQLDRAGVMARLLEAFRAGGQYPTPP